MLVPLMVILLVSLLDSASGSNKAGQTFLHKKAKEKVGWQSAREQSAERRAQSAERRAQSAGRRAQSAEGAEAGGAEWWVQD